MKNFTKQNFKTNPLWIRLLIMTFMLLAGAGNVWGYWVTGGAFAGWGNWTELTHESDSRYVVAIQNINSEFKLSTTDNYNSCWNDLGTSDSNVSLRINNDNNHKILGGSVDILCFDPTGYDGNGAVWTEKCAILKHPWDGGSNWYWKVLKKNSDGTFSITAIYRGGGLDYRYENMSSYVGSPTKVNNPQSGDECVFTFNPSNKTITITKVVTCDNNPDFSVSLSKSEVAVGCTGVTASITGDDSPTVTWSSTNPSVATIDSDGAINIKTAGTTTIKATTTEDGGFCGGVEKPATLTVKSPSVTVSPNDNSLCEGETLTLTATLTNCGVDNSIQWYKGDDPIEDETSAKLTISSVTTDNSGNYKAVVSDGILCSSVESTPITITVNARPSAPSLSNPEAICQGTTFTLPEKDDSEKTITWVSVDNKTLTDLTAGEHTYTAKIVENGCESTTVDYTITVKEQLAKPDLAVTNVKQCGSNYTAGKIVISNYNNANTYILKKGGNPIDKTYNNGYSLSENEIGTYTVEVSKDGACGATSDDNIGLTNNTPTVTPFEITKQANVCMGNPVTLSYDGTAQSGTISYAWYEGDSDVVLGTEETLTIQQAKNASYKLVVTVTSNDCPASDEATTTVEPKAVPSVPTFDNNAMDACVNQQFTLPTPNNLKYEEEPLWTVEGQPTTASQTINEAGEYTYIAYKNDGCPSQGTPFTVRVNPLPTITSISASNDEPVPFEDVVLTADGVTSGAEVNWYVGEILVAENTNTYTVTSETTGDVIVKAKAFLGDCESEAATKTVRFSAENCTPEVSNDIQITFTHPAKNNNNAACQYWGFGYIFKDGVTPNSNRTNYLAVFPDNDQTSGSKTVTLSNVQTAEIKVYLNAYHNYSECRASTQVFTLQRGGIYSITISSDQQGNGNWEKVPTVTKTGSLTHDPEIIAPAVKMISAEYDEENDVIVANGAVYKTGCGVTFWGFQYSEDGQAWGTEDTDYIRPISGNSLTVPGEFEYSFAIPTAGGGDIYYIRAYALNNYNGSYALSNAVYSATSLPVEIPSKTIESATISLVDIEGNPLDVTEVCPQSTVYLKVSYAGGDFTDFVAVENFPGTDLELVNHDKTNNYAIFSFTATAAGTANITISNKSGSTVTPANGVNITLEDVQVVTPPIITINPESAMICQGDDATISIVEENQNYTYTIYKDGEALNPQSFTITEAGVYTVGATENVCNTSATSMPIELKVVSSDVKIGLEADNTAIGPWQPLKLTVTPAKGYEYTLEGLDGMVYTKKGDVYTIKIPRPNDWSPGNSGTQQELEKEDKVFTAKIKVSDEVFCGSKEVTVTLTDTEENCE